MPTGFGLQMMNAQEAQNTMLGAYASIILWQIWKKITRPHSVNQGGFPARRKSQSGRHHAVMPDVG